MKLSMGLYEFTGDVRPVLPLEHAAEYQLGVVREEAELVKKGAELVKKEAELVKKEAELGKMKASRKSTQAVQIWQGFLNCFHLRK